MWRGASCSGRRGRADRCKRRRCRRRTPSGAIRGPARVPGPCQPALSRACRRCRCGARSCCPGRRCRRLGGCSCTRSLRWQPGCDGQPAGRARASGHACAGTCFIASAGAAGTSTAVPGAISSVAPLLPPQQLPLGRVARRGGSHAPHRGRRLVPDPPQQHVVRYRVSDGELPANHRGVHPAAEQPQALPQRYRLGSPGREPARKARRPLPGTDVARPRNALALLKGHAALLQGEQAQTQSRGPERREKQRTRRPAAGPDSAPLGSQQEPHSPRVPAFRSRQQRRSPVEVQHLRAPCLQEHLAEPERHCVACPRRGGRVQRGEAVARPCRVDVCAPGEEPGRRGGVSVGAGQHQASSPVVRCLVTHLGDRPAHDA
mmetsp:Transcript_8505/g.33622  ORF Transcript_8505/g.33622 Transcript_8505/m.33622 type:complete len:375 (-) Transcript_8505:2553-3677(-)